MIIYSLLKATLNHWASSEKSLPPNRRPIGFFFVVVWVYSFRQQNQKPFPHVGCQHWLCSAKALELGNSSFVAHKFPRKLKIFLMPTSLFYEPNSKTDVKRKNHRTSNFHSNRFHTLHFLRSLDIIVNLQYLWKWCQRQRTKKKSTEIAQFDCCAQSMVNRLTTKLLRLCRRNRNRNCKNDSFELTIIVFSEYLWDCLIVCAMLPHSIFDSLNRTKRLIKGSKYSKRRRAF